MDSTQAATISEYEGYDFGELGEAVSMAAKVSGGFRSGVIALTEDRLVYLRKSKKGTFIDRESRLNAVTKVTLKKFLGTRQLSFNDAGQSVVYTEQGDPLDAIFEALKRAVSEDQNESEIESAEELVETTEAVSDEGDSESYGVNLEVIEEPVLRAAKVVDGVIALTETKLFHLQQKKGSTIVARESDLSAISDVSLKKFLGMLQLSFNEHGQHVVYGHNRDDLEPFVEPLRAANDAKREFERDERLAGILCSAQGRNGQVHLFEDRVLITRQGFWSAITYGYRGDKEVLISEIISIGWKEPGFTAGYIHFEYIGGQAPVRTGVFADDSIVNNENAVLFDKEHQRDFEEFRKLLEEKRAELRKPQQVVATAAASPMEELKKLAELKEMGIVTEEEFEAKKKQLLGL